MKQHSNDLVSASSVGMAAKCAHYLELKETGAAPSAAAQTARIWGDRSHQRLNEIVEDKRCYIATHLYGENHHLTFLLRRFRNDVLSKYFAGRMFICLYYLVSPWIVIAAKKIAFIDRILSTAVVLIIKYLLEKHCD